MIRLVKRKTPLLLLTEGTARYRGRERRIVVEAMPEGATLRLAGTRTKYLISWRGAFDFGGRILAEHTVRERRAGKKA